MQASSQNVPLRTLKLKADQRVSPRRKDHASSSILAIDQEYYHGDATVSVPFNWESQPGTPKVNFRESYLPPLTPPPSYYYKACTASKTDKKPSKGRILSAIFPKVSKSGLPVSPAYSSISSSSSSSASSFGSPRPRRSGYSPRLWRSHASSSEAPSSRKLKFEEEAEVESPVSTLCFGFGREAIARSRGCCASSMIKVLLRDV